MLRLSQRHAIQSNSTESVDGNALKQRTNDEGLRARNKS